MSIKENVIVLDKKRFLKWSGFTSMNGLGWFSGASEAGQGRAGQDRAGFSWMEFTLPALDTLEKLPYAANFR